MAVGERRGGERSRGAPGEGARVEGSRQPRRRARDRRRDVTSRDAAALPTNASEAVRSSSRASSALSRPRVGAGGGGSEEAAPARGAGGGPEMKGGNTHPGGVFLWLSCPSSSVNARRPRRDSRVRGRTVAARMPPPHAKAKQRAAREVRVLNLEDFCTPCRLALHSQGARKKSIPPRVAVRVIRNESRLSDVSKHAPGGSVEGRDVVATTPGVRAKAFLRPLHAPPPPPRLPPRARHHDASLPFTPSPRLRPRLLLHAGT